MILQPGRNCWGRLPSGRVAVLVDGAAYYDALARTIARARRSVLIAAWDIDPEVRLVRDGPPLLDGRGRPLPDRLGPLLDAVARRHGVRTHVLAWDIGTVLAATRGVVPIFHVVGTRHPRVRVALDGDVPPGASHHHKVVVVDDRVAFAGGIDITRGRWDRRAHDPADPDRDPGEDPWHDVQLAVDGRAAAALGDLLREQWRRLRGRAPDPPRVDGDPWPPELRPRFRNVEVGIARTDPAWRGRREVREIERLWLDAIAAARHTVYIENQYLTSARVGEAIAARLAEPDGPEFVVVGPRRVRGWLEHAAMGVLRDRLVDRLRAADRHGRLHLLYPVVGEDRDVYVHAKVLVVDDRLLRVGSANLNNRSMGTDSEVDLAVEGADAATRAGILATRDDLVAEHLGRTPVQVRRAVARHGGLGPAIAALVAERPGGRRLAPLVEREPDWLHEMVPGDAVLDPEAPVTPEELVEQIVPARLRRSLREPALLATGVGLAVAALAVATPDHVPAWMGLAVEPLAPTRAVVLLALTTLLGLPLPVLVPAFGYVLGPGDGLAVALLGTTLADLLAWLAGRLLGRRRVARWGGARANAVAVRLSRPGALPVAAARLVPRLPSAAISLIAGATGVGARDFVLGTVAGMAPALGLLTLAGALVRAGVDADRPLLVAGGIALVALGAVTAWFVRRWVDHLEPPVAPAPAPGARGRGRALAR